jgi:hypothetical protein
MDRGLEANWIVEQVRLNGQHFDLQRLNRPDRLAQFRLGV